jgi:hypothetical protein
VDAAANAAKQLRSALCRSFVNLVGLGSVLDRCSRPEANPSRRRVGRLAKATSWSLHLDRRCRVGLTLQMTVGEEFARLECGNGGAAASIVPPTIPSRLGRAADRPRRPMPFQGVNLRANHLHRRRPVVRVGAMAWWTASSHWAWSWWRSGSYRHQATRVQPNSSTNRQLRRHPTVGGCQAARCWGAGQAVSSS